MGLKEIPPQKTVPGRGVLIEEIESQLKLNGIKTKLTGVPEPGKGDFEKAIEKLEKMFENKNSE
jgi:hypothetical protein